MGQNVAQSCVKITIWYEDAKMNSGKTRKKRKEKYASLLEAKSSSDWKQDEGELP